MGIKWLKDARGRWLGSIGLGKKGIPTVSPNRVVPYGTFRHDCTPELVIECAKEFWDAGYYLSPKDTQSIAERWLYKRALEKRQGVTTLIKAHPHVIARLILLDALFHTEPYESDSRQKLTVPVNEAVILTTIAALKSVGSFIDDNAFTGEGKYLEFLYPNPLIAELSEQIHTLDPNDKSGLGIEGLSTQPFSNDLPNVLEKSSGVSVQIARHQLVSLARILINAGEVRAMLIQDHYHSTNWELGYETTSRAEDFKLIAKRLLVLAETDETQLDPGSGLGFEKASIFRPLKNITGN
jgi:hypothetical protein